MSRTGTSSRGSLSRWATTLGMGIVIVGAAVGWVYRVGRVVQQQGAQQVRAVPTCTAASPSRVETRFQVDCDVLCGSGSHAWTPDFYYVRSPGAQRYVRLFKDGSRIPLEALDGAWHRPDLVEKALLGGH